MPAIAIGINDIAGTGFYSSEYIVGSYGVNKTDFHFGLGWGAMDGSSNNFKNPLSHISDEFINRPSNTEDMGGQFQPSRYFSGETTSPFFGISHVLSDKLIMKVENDKETLIYDDIVYAEDSIKILMPPYDAVIIVKSEGETLKGRYLKEESGKEASFYAIINDKPKFTSDKEADFSLDGKYKTVFRPENPYPGLGIFTQKDNKVSGTFRKNTGDTRYLSGITFGDSILLSTLIQFAIKTIKIKALTSSLD